MNHEHGFQTQMEFVKERNKIRYENKLMKEEDEVSKKSQQIFFEKEEKEEKEKKEKKEKIELERKYKEEAEIAEQLMIQLQIEKELCKFVDEYVISRMNSLTRNSLTRNSLIHESDNYYDSNIDNLRVDDLRREGENIFYERLLKRQQDEEYQKTLIRDMEKYK